MRARFAAMDQARLRRTRRSGCDEVRTSNFECRNDQGSLARAVFRDATMIATSWSASSSRRASSCEVRRSSCECRISVREPMSRSISSQNPASSDSGKLERYQAKIGVPPNSWRIRFTPLGETSYFAIFSAAARWKAYIIDEPIISTRSSPLRPILYGRSI